MKTTRDEVYAAIDGERDYQDNKWGNPRHDQDETVGNFILYIERYVQEAKDAFIDNGAAPEALRSIRKVTALGVACMENHGAPKR